MADINELSSLLFSNGENKDDAGAIANSAIQVFYGYALADSANGSVLVQIGEPVYSLDDLQDDDYEEVTLEEDSEDQVDLIDEDEDPEDDVDEEELEEIF